MAEPGLAAVGPHPLAICRKVFIRIGLGLDFDGEVVIPKRLLLRKTKGLA
jgi:hypothetical protein